MDRQDVRAHLPPAERTYLKNLTKILKDAFESELLGVYLFGSAASTTYYQPGVSDLDIAAVINNKLPQAAYLEFTAKISHKVLPCPARKLELVLYAQEGVNDPQRQPTFEVNFNTGNGMDDHVTYSIGDESSHWFVLDIASGRELGKTLYGTDVKQVFSTPQCSRINTAILSGIDWYKSRLMQDESDNQDGEKQKERVDAVLNACRARRWTITGKWGSKVEGGEWAVEKDGVELEVVHEALRIKKGGVAYLNRDQVVSFLGVVGESLRDPFCMAR